MTHPSANGRTRHGEEPRTQRFIPFRRADLVHMLEASGQLEPADQRHFRSFVRLLNAVFHHDFHARLEALKDAYAPFDPDPDTHVTHRYDDAEREAARRRLFSGLQVLLDAGNFEPVDEEQLRRAFEEESLLKVRLGVDHTDFEQVLFFRRGQTTREEEVASWFGLRRRPVVFTNYEKVVVVVTFKAASALGEKDVDGLSFAPGSTMLKLFQDVPRADLEMLYPNAEPRMRPLDKLLIGVPAAISAVAVFTTKLATTLGLLFLLAGFWLGLNDRPVELDQSTLIALGAGLGSLGGYLTRQFTKFKSRKLEFLKTLADSLYFRNLDNDAGVLHHLNDDAEEEEVKEALLGWYFLRAAGRPRTIAQLDGAIEEWLEQHWDVRLDFEVEDGVRKLRDLRLVQEFDDGRLEAVPADEALCRLDERWDDYFVHDQPADVETLPNGRDVAPR